MHHSWPIHQVLAEMAGQDPSAAFCRLLPSLRSNYGAPRDEALMAAFLGERLPAGRYAIYGAGTLGRLAFQALADRCDVTVVAFLDRQAARFEGFCGRDVLPLERAGGLAVDGVVVAHHHWEGSMVAALRQHGVPVERIFPVFRNSHFIEWSLRRLAPQIDAWRNRGIEHLVISCAEPQWSLLRDAELASFLPPDRTLHVYFGRGEVIRRKALDTVFPMVDVRLSLVLLDLLMAAVAPRGVYVKLSAHHGGHFLGAYLKNRFPSCVIVQEMYDQALMLSDRKLQDGCNCGVQDIDAFRLAELISMRTCDLVVTKNGGEAWDEVCRTLDTTHALYYPRIGSGRPHAASGDADDPLSIVFAGSLPRPTVTGQPSEHTDMQYIEMLRRMRPTERVRVDLYNASHRYPEHDPIFAPYHAAFRSNPFISYHRGVPFQEMTRILPRYDFGWHVMHDGSPETVEPVSRVGIGNKFTTYLASGLPVLIDADFNYMADLVASYGAGLVVDADIPADLDERLLSMDRAALARGVERLTTMMRTRNEESRGLIAERLRGHRYCVPPLPGR